MCGICGFAGDRRFELLEPMTSVIAHRGPDDSGAWSDPAGEVGLGFRRLAIIDLSPAGHQPMANEDGSVHIVFNGEIYDYKEHRRKLLDRGHVFRSRTDTEVLVHLYEDLGPGFLSEINGMFALALWDSKKKRLLLARDHAGIKPLYYWTDGRKLFFGSEIKSLLRVPEVSRELNFERLPEFLTFLWVPGDETLLRGIRKLEPGHYMLWEDGRIQLHRWFTLAYEPDESVPEHEWAERVEETFLRTTKRQMVSDVPLGAFLSGGADSSSIVACMRDAFPDREIRCYTTRYRPGDLARDQFTDDFPFAQAVAQRLDVTLKSVELDPRLVELLPKMVYHLDEPDADPAVFPSYLISKLAKDDGTTVLLSGTGGDEVFFGYRSHQAWRTYQRLAWMPRPLLAATVGAAGSLGSAAFGAGSALARRLKKFREGLVRDGLDRHMALVDWSSPQARAGLWAAAVSQRLRLNGHPPAAMQRAWDGFEGKGEINRHTWVLIQSFLAAHNFLYTDKSSMAASLEVRVPFMDLELMRLSARIPERIQMSSGVTKSVLKRAMEKRLGREVLHRSKTGFGVPLRKWMAEDLRPTLSRLLSPERVRARGLFEPAAVSRLIAENDAGRADHSYLLYCLITLEVWQQTFLDRPGVEITLDPAGAAGAG